MFAPKLWCASLLCERRCPGRTAQGARRRLKPTQGQVRQADGRMADSLSAEFFFQMAFGDKAVGIPEATPLRQLCPGAPPEETPEEEAQPETSSLGGFHKGSAFL